MPRPTVLAITALPIAALLLGSPTAASARAAEADAPEAAGVEWHASADAARTEAAATGRLILIDLFAEWCGWCKRLDRETLADPAFLDWATERFVLLRVDVEDGGEGTRLKQRFRVNGLPTTLIADRHLGRVGAVDGFHDAEGMRERLERELARHDRLLEDYRRTLAEGSPAALQRLADRLHGRGDGMRAAAIYERLLAAEADPAGSRARLELALADAYRLALDFQRAEAALGRARRAADAEAEAGADPKIDDATALLEVLLARDRGDCRRATVAVEELLDDHPRSRASVDAVVALRSLETDPRGDCQ